MGGDQRPLLLYLPGMDGTGRLLHRQPGLDTAYRVVCATYPQDRAATYEDLALAAADRLEAAGAGRPGVVLAESFGGAVALTLALVRPGLVERMVLVNTFAHFPRRGLIRLSVWLGRFLPQRPAHPGTRWLRGPFFFAPEIPPRERQEWWDRTEDVPLAAFGRRAHLIADLDLRPRLAEVTAPTLVLVSRDDPLVPPGCGRELARLLPAARLLEVLTRHAALIHPRVDVARLLADANLWNVVDRRRKRSG